MDDLVKIIANQGFSIAVSIYLLVRMEGKIELLGCTINDLSKSLLQIELEREKNKFFKQLFKPKKGKSQHKKCKRCFVYGFWNKSTLICP